MATLVWPLMFGVMGSAATKPHIVHVLIDDLGYHDTNFRNHQVETPTIDAMVADGIEIKEFYVYKMCAPSRASTLSGRYPMHVGYYNNNGCNAGGVPLKFDLLPAVLKRAGYKTHALGKWHVGWTTRAYTPTFRGFDTFLGTSGNTGDYWYHLYDSEHKCNVTDTPTGWPIVDIVDAVATGPDGVVGPANSSGINGTYDARLLTQRAVKIIHGHPQDSPLFIYMALHNVHVPMHAPLDTVRRFPHVASDARKLANAMLLEADWALGNVSAALQAAGLLNNTVFFVNTDNGGPGSHACNWPLRGGKFTFWEGGVRGMAFAHSALFPPARRGTQFKGQAHLTDIYMTAAVGLAGLSASALNSSTGPLPPDGFNLWPALIGGLPSPRNEVVHLPFNNRYANTSDCASVNNSNGCSPSMRVGDYKIIYGWPGEDELKPLPPLSPTPVPYGLQGGTVRNGNQAIGPHWKDKNVTHQSATCMQGSSPSYCLFDVVADPGESHDLAADPSYKSTLDRLVARLHEVSASAAPVCDAMTKQDYKNNILPRICHIARTTGFWLPVDWNGHMPPPIKSPCEIAIDDHCPSSTYPSVSACKKCCHDAPAVTAACHPKDKAHFCNTTRIPNGPSPKPPPHPPSPSPAPAPPVPAKCDREVRALCPASKFPKPKECRSCCKQGKKQGKLSDCHPHDFSRYCNGTKFSPSVYW